MKNQRGLPSTTFVTPPLSARNDIFEKECPNFRKSPKRESGAGFTIIELLVVIAIIGVLAAIVLVNVVRYIDKGKDAAAKGDMATLFTNAIVYYNENSDFDGVKNDDDYKNVIKSLKSDKMGYLIIKDRCDKSEACNYNDQKWCASIELKAVSEKTYYCIDSRGAKKESTTAECNSGVCPD